MDKNQNRKRFEARLRMLDDNPGEVARAAQTRRRGLALPKGTEFKTAIRPLRIGVRLVSVFVCFFLLKAMFAEITGPELYDNQVAELSNGGGWETIMGVVMQRGPAMKWAEPAVAKVMDVERSRQTAQALDEGVLKQTSGAPDQSTDTELQQTGTAAQ